MRMGMIKLPATIGFILGGYGGGVDEVSNATDITLWEIRSKYGGLEVNILPLRQYEFGKGVSQKYDCKEGRIGKYECASFVSHAGESTGQSNCHESTLFSIYLEFKAVNVAHA
ncbi:hypothetical protein CEXT_356041 [Caerostris extrusa]|uniref:Uncharacterized protein n=1 Tax=Caerostris extrusa TaxID=172846 RepID=A0AAV4R1Y8_CAEEX|nr:hypothetical protein CEXT_356041 [Caerostris extrusa]